MNILFASVSYFEPGKPAQGLPNYLRRVTIGLTQMGHKTTIIYPSDHSYRRVENGVEILAVEYPKGVTNDLINLFMIKGYFINLQIEQLIKKYHYDIIQFASVGGIGAFYSGNVPSVLRLSSFAPIWYNNSNTLSKRQVERLTNLEVDSSLCADGVFAPSHVTANAFADCINRKVEVIESPFVNDTTEYDKSFFNENLKGKKYVLNFGVLTVEKGIKELANCLRPFLREHEDYYAVFLGRNSKIDGIPSDEYIKGLAGDCSDRVEIYNAVEHSQLYPIIKNARFVVLPSWMENLSNACIEAMYLGQVVIGTRGASYEQLIDDGISGFLCEIKNSEDILKKMIIAADLDDMEKAKLSQKAKERIMELRPEKVISELLNYYQKIIACDKGKKDSNISKNYIKRVEELLDQ